MKILVTGGVGYIGSHTVVELQKEGYEVVIVDNLCNSSEVVVDRIEQITKIRPIFCKVDVREKIKLMQIFKEHNFDAVIHFAGLKAVGESVSKPLKYYSNNIIGAINIMECMELFGVKNLVFSSSATVYGQPSKMPITEEFPIGNCTNPYGKTKYFIEEMLSDWAVSNKSLNVALLRYFNPVGAHESGLIGEDPSEIPNNLTPYILRVALGQYPMVNVFGDDYPTKDGTGVRDYIHITDLAKGHLCALDKLHENCGLVIYNLGTGIGYSVLEVIKAFEKASNRVIPYKIVERREGDIAECYADCSKAFKQLRWKCQKNLTDMANDSWNWQQKNPNGYKSK
ncbi:MAG: UDP-glucose 4-epimerase GalE [Clostridia bacterium]